MRYFTQASCQLLLTIVLVLSAWRVSAQSPPTWTRTLRLGGPSTDQVSHTITDAAGNVYQVGTFLQTIQVGSNSLTVGSMASYDMYLVKSDPLGNVLWARQAGTMTNGSAYGAAEGNQLALDAAGNLYVAGSFAGGVTFGSAATTLTAINSRFAAFLVKYTSQGTALWAQQAPTTGTGFGTGLAIADNGDIFMSGSFNSTITFGTTVLTSQTSSLDIFLARYSTTGSLQWVQSAGGANNDYGSKVVSAPNGGVYLAGEFTGSLTLGTISGNGYGNSDCYLAHYSSLGVAQWVQVWGGTDNDYLRDLARTSSGDIYAAGAFTGFATFGAFGLLGQGGTDGFVIKCTSQGTTTWVQQLGGTGNDYATALAAHPSGALYVAGRFSGSAVVANQTLSSVGGFDIFLARYDQAGTGIWAVRGGSTSDDFTGGVGYASGGFVELSVQFSGTAQFGSLSVNSLGQSDVVRCQLKDNTALSQRNQLYNSQMTLSPNPATSSLVQLAGFTNTTKITGIRIRDIAGKLVMSYPPFTPISSSSTLALDISGLANGPYILELSTMDDIVTKKLLVQK